jgi:predicted HTH transcriptional regulator
MQATCIDNNAEKSSILLGKEDIESLITNKIEESAILDYKASGSISAGPKKKDEIIKDVSAFANSNGGRIIYGVAEYKEREKRNLPEKMDPIDQRNFSKEWLEHIIVQIKPMVEGIRIHPVPLLPLIGIIVMS